jgi:hypothetical protein
MRGRGADILKQRNLACFALSISLVLTCGCVANQSNPAARSPAIMVPAGERRAMEITLNPQEMAVLQRPVSGQGGYQTLLRGLRRKLDRHSGNLRLSHHDLERIPRYAFDYGNGGWEDRLRAVFARHLGSQLGRSWSGFGNFRTASVRPEEPQSEAKWRLEGSSAALASFETASQPSASIPPQDERTWVRLTVSRSKLAT